MPILPNVPIYLLALGLIIGAILGWMYRADRCVKEKISANATLHQELERKKSEGARLADENKNLMEQVSKYRSLQDTHRADTRKLSDALQLAITNGNELQQRFNDMRENLELTVSEKEELKDKLQYFSAVTGGNETDPGTQRGNVKDYKPSEENTDTHAQQIKRIVSIGSPQNSDDIHPDKDDLKIIRGIGPSIEKIFNDFGFYKFRQIADLTEYEMENLAQQLKGFRSRIYREDWIGQARDLEQEKSNGRPKNG
ncbi:MAG: hypothetical protein CMO98_02475 [Woeseia sp.]|nr:hypothetical protein [Woeseia sp.]